MELSNGLESIFPQISLYFASLSLVWFHFDDMLHELQQFSGYNNLFNLKFVQIAFPNLPSQPLTLPTPRFVLQALNLFKIEIFASVPLLLEAIQQVVEAEQLVDMLKVLKFIAHGGAPLSVNCDNFYKVYSLFFAFNF
jgi:hypothetical protein